MKPIVAFFAAGIAVTTVATACRAKPDADDSGPSFRVEVKPPSTCAKGTTCEAQVELTALGGYKVNDQYPFKFITDAGPKVDSRFEHTGVKTGRLTMRFRADAAGTLHVAGTFKLSVCTPRTCKLESPAIAFDVPVT